MTPPLSPVGDLSCTDVQEATGAPGENVLATWPHVLRAMRSEGVASLRSQIGMVCTIGTETWISKVIKGVRRNLTFLPIEELGSGSQYDTGRLAERLGNTPEDDDDGEFYKGRGLIQTTGRANYAAFEQRTGIPVLTKPALLLEPENAALAAAFFWKDKAVWRACDLGDWPRVRKLVNGGMNGWDRFKSVLAPLIRRFDPHQPE